jgi:opacity protein-like surface antigen
MKRILAFSILITSMFCLSAQDRSFNFGLHLAPNLSWMKSDIANGVYESNGSSVHLSYGADFNYFFAKNIGLGTGINIVHTGGNLRYETKYPTSDDSTGILERKYKLQYLEIPLCIIGTTGDLLGKYAIYAKFGLGTSFKLRARSDDNFTPSYNNALTVTNDNYDISNDVGFMRESLIVGAGATYKVADVITINVGLNYNNCFTDVLTGKNKADPNIEEDARAHYFELTLGVLF